MGYQVSFLDDDSVRAHAKDVLSYKKLVVGASVVAAISFAAVGFRAQSAQSIYLPDVATCLAASSIIGYVRRQEEKYTNEVLTQQRFKGTVYWVEGKGKVTNDALKKIIDDNSMEVDQTVVLSSEITLELNGIEVANVPYTRDRTFRRGPSIVRELKAVTLSVQVLEILGMRGSAPKPPTFPPPSPESRISDDDVSPLQDGAGEADLPQTGQTPFVASQLGSDDTPNVSVQGRKPSAK